MFLIEEKCALITGATSGIGYEFARIFAAHDYDLVIVARSQGELDSTAGQLTEDYGVKVHTLARDLCVPESPFDIFDEIKRLGITINVLVNNAGQTVYGKYIETDIHSELALLQLNVGAYISLTKLFLRDMLLRGEGKILNVASIAAKMPGPYMSVYHGTKAFIHSFTEAVRAEVSDSGVTLTSLLPGATATGIFQKAHMENSKIVNHGLTNPAQVAEAGFEALMAGEDMVIAGASNKLLVNAANLLPDKLAAQAVMKYQEPYRR